MIYCKQCLYPDTKPDLTFDDHGVCIACRSFEKRKDIDWKQREKEFKELIEDSKNRNNYGKIYDCIIPVSGGKDSHFQIIKALEYGLHPLAVTASTDDLSAIGRRNLDNISKLGVDHVIVSVNAELRRRINKYTLILIGDISWAEHITIFTIPIREAIIRQIPLVIWGENPQNEYGGPEADKAGMKDSWLQEFGGLNGLRVTDLIERNIATKQEMLQYVMPWYSPVTYKLPTSIFLGHYFPWDGRANALIAKEHGFEWSVSLVEGTGVNYENLDNHQTGIHDYFKWLKFGFGRATDIACNHIRRKYLTRDEGKEFIYLYDGQFPSTYLGKSLESILVNIDMSVDQFMEIADKFTNKAIFEPRIKDQPRPKLKYKIMEV